MSLFPPSPHLKCKIKFRGQKQNKLYYLKRHISFTKNSITINPEATLVSVFTSLLLLFADLYITPMHLYTLFHLFYSLSRVKCSLLLSACNPLCVWSGEYDVSSAALCPWVMEQRAICLSDRPSVRALRSYQCVSPANEKLAGSLLQPSKWVTSLRGGGCRAHLAHPSLFFFFVSFPFPHANTQF